MSEQLTTIPVELLVFSGRNPRTEMRGLKEFAENIKKYGVRQPIVVRPRGEKFEVVSGERRVRASIIAGLKEVPAIIRALTNRQADIERLIENIHRDDLTNAEKGDGILALLEYDAFPTIKSVAEVINKSPKVVAQWLYKAEKLSPFVRENLARATIGEKQAQYLLKYDHLSQDKLAKKMIQYELTKRETVVFLRLYDENPRGNLDDFAKEAKGIKKVEVDLTKLSEGAKEEIEELIKEREERAKRERKKALRKMWKAPRRSKKKTKKEKKSKPPPPLLPEERERLEETRAKEIQRIVKERERRAEFMRTRAELGEMEVKLPAELDEEYRRWIDENRRKEIVERNKLNDMASTDEWMKFTKSWFIHHPPPRKHGEILHPAKFPETMIAEFIEFFTKRGQVVLDPLLGTGSTLVACDMTGRIGIGVELEEQWAKIAKTRTKQTVIVGDSRNIEKMNLPQVDFVITSPPYWNQLKRSSMRQKDRIELGIPTEYSENERNIGNIDEYMTFIEEQREIFDKVYELVKLGGYLVIITNNVFFEGRLYPLAFDTAISLSRSGKWILKDEKIWLQDDKKLLPLGVLYAWVGNRCHEYCLIFRKES